eukprot:4803993-Ditylum_brightwellii.AAC.1
MQEVDTDEAANWCNSVLLDEAQKTVMFVDVTFPIDINMVKTAEEKYKKYRDLEIATKNYYHLQK